MERVAVIYPPSPSKIYGYKQTSSERDLDAISGGTKERWLNFCSFFKYKYSAHLYAFMLIYPSVQLEFGGKCIVSGDGPEDEENKQ